jgi:5-hydroxyisourate hydrolase
MGKLSTHVLDTAAGRPAAGMKVELFRVVGDHAELLVSTTTNADGRTAEPLLVGAALTTGTYRLTFEAGDYFAAVGNADAKKFLDRVTIYFVVNDATANYHVPLLVSPWSYSTYRGS